MMPADLGHQAKLFAQTLLVPLTTRAGRNIKAAINANIPPTAKPKTRNGNVISQIMG
jgi:hypothetical protein